MVAGTAFRTDLVLDEERVGKRVAVAAAADVVAVAKMELDIAEGEWAIGGSSVKLVLAQARYGDAVSALLRATEDVLRYGSGALGPVASAMAAEEVAKQGMPK